MQMSHNSYLTTLIEELEKAILLARKMEESGKQPAIEQAILLEKLRNAYDFLLFQNSKIISEPTVSTEEKADFNQHIASTPSRPTETIFVPNVDVKNNPAKVTINEIENIRPKEIPSSGSEKRVTKSDSRVNPTPPVKVEDKAAKPTETLGEKLRSGRRFLNEFLAENTEKHDVASMMQSKPIKDLNKAIGINDKFLFTRELFGGDSQRFQDTIHDLNSMNTIEEALIYVGDNFDWQANDQTVIKLIELLQRRFIIQP